MTQRRRTQSGLTLIEIMIVVGIIGIMVAVAFPSVTSGIDSLRIRSASDQIVSTFNSAMNRADRRQIPVEVVIDPPQRRLFFASADASYRRDLILPDGVTIEHVYPLIPGLDEGLPRQFLLHPGGTVPRIAVELKNRRNVRMMVSVDPITGGAQAAILP